MRSHIFLLLVFLGGPALAFAQWTIQDSHAQVDLFGIDNVGNGVAWASGANGTVLRTTNDGQLWESCAIPPKAEHLAFSSIQAKDENTAIVMSSGKGSLSQLYKTTDGCKTWKSVFENPDTTGSFDSLLHVTGQQFYLLGNPVDGKFAMFLSEDNGGSWAATSDPGFDAAAGEVADNSSFKTQTALLFFATRGAAPAHFYYTYAKCDSPTATSCAMAWGRADLPIQEASSIATRTQLNLGTGAVKVMGVAVGGNSGKPEDSASTAAFTTDGKSWQLAATMPKGYRSAVSYNKTAGTWVAVGPNGTDISTDDGKHWQPLTNGASESDKNWNALSLPFAVGSNGHIGKLK